MPSQPDRQAAQLPRLAAGEGRVHLRPVRPAGALPSAPRSWPRSGRWRWPGPPTARSAGPPPWSWPAAALARVGGGRRMSGLPPPRPTTWERPATSTSSPPPRSRPPGPRRRPAGRWTCPASWPRCASWSATTAGQPWPSCTIRTTAPTPPSRGSASPASAWPTPRAGTSASPAGARCWPACAPRASPITRVQALQRLVPESGAALRRWHADHLDPAAPPAAAAVTSALLATATLATQPAARPTWPFTMDARRAGSAIRAAGGGAGGRRRGPGPPPAVPGRPGRRAPTWTSRTGSAPRDLAEVIRTAFDPSAAAGLADRRAAAVVRGARPGWTGGRRPASAPAWPGRSTPRPGPAATCTTARSPRRTGCTTGPGAGVLHGAGAAARRRDPTAGRSRCTSSRCRPRQPSGR